MEKLKCLRCGVEMKTIKREYLQLGKTGWIVGDWGNLVAGALYVTIMGCPKCGKLEFFNAEGLISEEDDQPGGSIAQTKCPRCGRAHDLDDPKCPFCGETNPNW